MGHKYIWQNSQWPNLVWSSEALLLPLGKARRAQGRILSQAQFIGLDARADILVEEAFSTSAIEGENYDRKTIRSSGAKRLVLSTVGLPKQQKEVDGLVEVLIDATTHFDDSLTAKRLHGWQASLFPTGHSGLHKIQTGKWRTVREPMQVVSGPQGKERVHYEAPPAKSIPAEMKAFLEWWKKPPVHLDGLLRAGIAHFWFVSIHPYEDGNGRIARAISEMALAQDENSAKRFYSVSAQIVQERENYYEILEASQKQSCDITQWLEWFLGVYTRAVAHSEAIVQKALAVAKFWQLHSEIELNERQIKVIQKLLEAETEGFKGGLNNRKYVSLTKTSRETAKRDLIDLEAKGLLKRNPGGGRSVSYALNKSRLNF